jgi:Fe-S-cluster containining protein
MEFNCSGCGACCKRIGLQKDKFKELNFPYAVNEKGWCEMLDENNKCKVYDNRPEICRMDKTYDNYFSKLMTRAEYYTVNTKLCNQFMKEDGADSVLLLDENQYKL